MSQELSLSLIGKSNTSETDAALLKLSEELKRTAQASGDLEKEAARTAATLRGWIPDIHTTEAAIQKLGGAEGVAADQARKLGPALLEAQRAGQQLGAGAAGVVSKWLELKEVDEAAEKTSSAFRGLLGAAREVVGGTGPAGEAIAGLGEAGLVGSAGVLAVGAALLAGVGIITEWTREAMGAAFDLANLSQETGIGTEKLRTFAIAGAQVGIGQDQMANMIVRASRLIADGGEKTVAALHKLGLTEEELKKAAPAEQFEAIINGLRGISDPAERAQAAFALFGRSPEILKLVSQNLEETGAEAQKFGLVVDDVSTQALANMQRSLITVGEEWESFKTSVALAAVEAVGGKQGLADLASTLGEFTGAVRAHVPEMAEALRLWGLAFQITTGPLRMAYETLDHELLGITESQRKLNESEVAAATINDLVAIKAKAHAKELADLAVKQEEATRGFQKFRDQQIEKEHKAAEAAAAAHAKAVAELAAQLTGGGRSAGILKDALASLGGVGKITSEELEKIGPKLEMAAAHGENLGKVGEEALKKWLDWKQAEVVMGLYGASLAKANKVAIDFAESTKKAAEDMTGGKQEEAAAAAANAWDAVIDKSRILTPELERVATAMAQEAIVGRGSAADTAILGEALQQLGARATTMSAQALASTIERLKALRQAMHDANQDTTAIDGTIATLSNTSVVTATHVKTFSESMTHTATVLHGVGDALNAASGLMQAFGVSSESTAAHAVAALSGIANAGAGMASAIASGNPMAMVSAGIGLATSLVSGFRSVFGTPTWVHIGQEAGHQLGIEVGQAMAEAIQQTMDQLDLSAANAALLHITDAAEAAHVNIRTMSGDIVNLMAGMAAGEIPATEGAQQLGEAWTAVRDSAEQAHIVGDSATRSIIAAARATGQMTDEMRSFLAGLVDESVTGSELIASGFARAASDASRAAAAGTELTRNQQRFFDAAKASQDPSIYDELRRQMEATGASAEEIARTIDHKMGAALDRLHQQLLDNQGTQASGQVSDMGEEWGTSAAMFFVYGFQAEIERDGIVKALDSSHDQLQSFYDQMTASGNDAGAALIAPFIQLDNSMTESLRGVLEVNTGMDQVFKSMADSGDLTAQGFAAMQTNILGTFTAMGNGGVATQQQLQAIFPSLRDLVSASQEYGFQLDANTQALVDQATAAGFAFPVDPLHQMVDLLSELVTVMGGRLPDSVRASGEAYQTLGDDGAAAADRIIASNDEMLTQVEKHTNDAINAGIAGFQDLGQVATDQGDYMGVAWNGNIGELIGLAQDGLPLATEAFVTMGADSTEPVNALAAATGQLKGNLAGAAQSALDLKAGLTDLPSVPVFGGGGSAGAPPIPPDRQFAVGGTVHAPESGMNVRVHGTEHILRPEQLQSMIHEAVRAGAGAGGGAGPMAPVQLVLNGRVLGEVLFQMSKTGDLRVDALAVT